MSPQAADPDANELTTERIKTSLRWDAAFFVPLINFTINKHDRLERDFLWRHQGYSEYYWLNDVDSTHRSLLQSEFNTPWISLRSLGEPNDHNQAKGSHEAGHQLDKSNQADERGVFTA